MPVSARRTRERTARRRSILDAAREVAEAEGWAAVTTRRLAGLIDYSQPVLYSHFSSKNEIVAAVAVEGFAELAADMAASRTASPTPTDALLAVCRTYLEFAATKPALYEAMSTQPTTLAFGQPETPAPLQAAFAELRAALSPVAAVHDADLCTEIVWSTLHGMAMLSAGGRLRPMDREHRLTMLVDILQS